MATDAVAFETMEDPQIDTGDNMSLPEFCYVWQWPCVFFVTQSTGRNLTVSQTGGHVVQKVTVKKTVKNCDDTPNATLSEEKTVWEYFTFRLGDPVDSTSRAETNVDTVRIVFPKDKKTDVELTLEASYHQNMTGVTVTAQPDLAGSDGILSGQPNGFNATLVRKFKASAVCCNGTHSFSWDSSAGNMWENYAESWRQNNTQEIPLHEKRVD